MRIQIQTVLDREQEIARQHVRAGNKVRALIALRRRKYQENLLATTEGQLETLEQLVRRFRKHTVLSGSHVLLGVHD